jgi:hypothetical protein
MEPSNIALARAVAGRTAVQTSLLRITLAPEN